MPALKNPRHEQFAVLVAAGESASKAYVLAGFSEKGCAASANRLLKVANVEARIAEFRAEAERSRAKKAEINREWVRAKLRENVERAMQVIPVRDAEGNPTGEYKYEGSVANRALELLGKDEGMFTEHLNVKLNAQVSTTAVTLAGVMTQTELRALEQRALAAQKQQQIAAGPVVEATAEIVQEEKP